jgi:hypothetical protein
MSLFTLDISAILLSPVGTMEEFHFCQEIQGDMWDDLLCETTLEMNIKIVRQDYGVDCILGQLKTTISILSEGIDKKEIEIDGVTREFHLKKNPNDTDDVSYIETRDMTIDLSFILEQELLIAGF